MISELAAAHKKGAILALIALFYRKAP